MSLVSPLELFRGTTVVVAPHMDDGVLGCGGSLARLGDCSHVHMVYATDGMRGPAPELPWIDRVDPSLASLREEEARNAMAILGLPEESVHFLGLPDGRLGRHRDELGRRLVALLTRLEAVTVLVPFRYDRHPDHLAVNRAVTSAVSGGLVTVDLYEFFVYHRWKLLKGGDVRGYVLPEELLEIDVREVAPIKRSALEAFVTQTTRFYEWQSRPNLTQELIANVSLEPEMFVRFRRDLAGPKIFGGLVPWIRVVHRVEPFLKRHKDRMIAVSRRLARAARRSRTG